MGAYHFAGGSIAFLLILNLLIVSFPTAMETYTGVNTTALQDSTNVSAGVDANQTSEDNVVDQMGDLVSIYTDFDSQNPILLAISTLFVALLIVLLVDLVWIG